jgi:hypothetical protein
MGLFDLVGDLIKTKVKVPRFTPITGGQAVEGTLSDLETYLPRASEATRRINAENQGQLDQQFASKIPGLSEIEATIARNIQAQLSGELPPDVASQVARRSNARAVEGGYGGSEFGENLVARDLGLTSLQLSQTGFTNALNWISNVRANRTAPILSPTTMFLSPEQRLQLMVGERDREMNRDYLSNQLKAAQSWQTSLGNQFSNLDQVLSSAASSYGGSMLGGVASGSFGGGGVPRASPMAGVDMPTFNSIGYA